jgi:hypothetical protein
LDSFWNSNINDVNTLKELLQDFLLVAFDLEFSSNKDDSTALNIIEARVAFFQPDPNHCLPSIPQGINVETFFEQNQIKHIRYAPSNTGKERTTRTAQVWDKITR